VVAPGSVNTGFGGGQSSIGSGAGTAEEIEKKVLRGKKKLQPEDVADVVAMVVTQPPQSFISEVRMRPTQKP
jgi:NADP-dependent 3-hydroxy acid dehydrogenase YdfG